MATYEEEMLKKQQQEAEKQNQGQTQQQNQAGSAQATSLAQMTQANAPEITSAQQYLDAIVKGEKPQYQTAYAPQIQQLYDKVMNRGEFKYDVNSDPVYQQLRGEWQNAGRMAMEDTIAQATGLSGGYGNSFAQAAGQQQYNQHMQQMGAMIPQLRNQAYQEYANEGEMLQNQLLTAQQMDALEYEKFRNEVGDLWNQQQFNYNKEQDLKNYEMAMQQMTMAQRESAFQQAMAMMQAGLNPGAEMLMQAGISEEDAKAYLNRMKGYGSGGGSSTKKGISNDIGDSISQALAGLNPAAKVVSNLWNAITNPQKNTDYSKGFDMENMNPEMAEEAVQKMMKLFGNK